MWSVLTSDFVYKYESTVIWLEGYSFKIGNHGVGNLSDAGMRAHNSLS
jgi:hypothetical protein